MVETKHTFDAIRRSNLTTTVELNLVDDIIAVKPGRACFINMDFLSGNKATAYPGHMIQYLHSLFMNVGGEARITHKRPHTVEPLSVVHAFSLTCSNMKM